MKTFSFSLFAASVASLALFLTGCTGSPSGTPAANAKPPATQHAGDNDQEAEAKERQAAFAQLSDEDRRLAEAQGYCAVAGKPLGSMGPPIKLMVKNQAVFLCCQGCENKAKSNPDKTLAKVAELKTKVKSEHAHN